MDRPNKTQRNKIFMWASIAVIAASTFVGMMGFIVHAESQYNERRRTIELVCARQNEVITILEEIAQVSYGVEDKAPGIKAKIERLEAQPCDVDLP